MTPDATRRRAIGQILLLTAGFLVLVAISATSVILVNQAREANGLVVHTIEVENQINALLLEIRRAESSARGYLLTQGSEFLADHNAAMPGILPAVDNLVQWEGGIEAVRCWAAAFEAAKGVKSPRFVSGAATEALRKHGVRVFAASPGPP